MRQTQVLIPERERGFKSHFWQGFKFVLYKTIIVLINIPAYKSQNCERFHNDLLNR